MNTPKPNRIFLSYASQDIETAWNVYKHLTDLGYALWFDKKDLPQGRDWAEGITKGIQSCTLILPVAPKTSETATLVNQPKQPSKSKKRWIWGAVLAGVLVVFNLLPKTPEPVPTNPKPVTPEHTNNPPVQEVKHQSGDAGEVDGIEGVYIVENGETQFWMKHEVTQKDFAEFVTAVNLVTESEKRNG